MRMIVKLVFSVVVGLTFGLSAFAGELKGSGRTPNNTMLVKIDTGGQSNMSESIVLPLNKAAIVELPADAHDVLVSNPEVVDAVVRTARRTFLLGRKVGQTNAFFLDANGKQILNLEIQVERDLDNLQGMIASYLPTSRIEVRAINDNIVLSGYVGSPAEAEQARNLATRFIGDPTKVLSMVTVEGNEQVLLKVRVVEMQRSIIKQLGVSVGSFLNVGDVDMVAATDNPFSLFGSALTGTGVSARHIGSRWDVEGVLRLMERSGLIKTLAEPNLTAISGEAANFLAGGEFPVPVSRDGDGNLGLEFKSFGVGLGFTPLVMSEGRISLRISTEVSELTQDGAFVFQESIQFDENGNLVRVPGLSVPSLKVRRAETTVELPSGGSLVMAGLIKETTKQQLDGLPGAKDVPILGALFRSREYLSEETELVIIVTPYLVNPVNEQELQTPADGFAEATDLDAVLLGRLNAVYGLNPDKEALAKWQGPVGYLVK